MSGMGGLCIARAQKLYYELKKLVKKSAASRSNSARLPRSWKTLRAFAYQGGSRKAPLARTTLGMVKIAQDWAISLSVPKSVMAAHGTASQTERESLDDDGPASQNRVKVQSGPFSDVGDKPCLQQLISQNTHRTRLYVSVHHASPTHGASRLTFHASSCTRSCPRTLYSLEYLREVLPILRACRDSSRVFIHSIVHLIGAWVKSLCALSALCPGGKVVTERV